MFFKGNIWRKASQKIIKHLNTLPDIEKGGIVVAISGGIDSVFLLTALTQLQRKYKYTLYPVYIQHNLIPENDLYSKIAVLCAKKLGWDCAMFSIEPKPRKFNLEDWMRNERYRLLEEYRKKVKADYLAVAHHEEDQAETVLAHIIRGCGLKGLSAMPFQRDPEPDGTGRDKIIRPIINVPKKDIYNLLRGTSLPYYEDKLNYSLDYQRNKIRHELLPYLRENFNPQISTCLVKLADAARGELDNFKF